MSLWIGPLTARLDRQLGLSQYYHRELASGECIFQTTRPFAVPLVARFTKSDLIRSLSFYSLLDALWSFTSHISTSKMRTNEIRTLFLQHTYSDGIVIRWRILWRSWRCILLNSGRNCIPRFKGIRERKDLHTFVSSYVIHSQFQRVDISPSPRDDDEASYNHVLN